MKGVTISLNDIVFITIGSTLIYTIMNILYINRDSSLHETISDIFGDGKILVWLLILEIFLILIVILTLPLE